MSDEEKVQLIYDTLYRKYGRVEISLQEYILEVPQSTCTVSKKIASGYGIPAYKRHGKAKNSRVTFNLVDVAEFLANTIKTIY